MAAGRRCIWRSQNDRTIFDFFDFFMSNRIIRHVHGMFGRQAPITAKHAAYLAGRRQSPSDVRHIGRRQATKQASTLGMFSAGKWK
jgi:hypothetical protein